MVVSTELMMQICLRKEFLKLTCRMLALRWSENVHRLAPEIVTSQNRGYSCLLDRPPDQSVVSKPPFDDINNFDQ